MKDTFTTVVEQQGEHIEIVTLHDQTGSASIGTVPLANIPKLIEGLKKFISFQPRVMLSFPSDELVETFYPIKFKLGETRAEQERKEKNIELRKVIDWYKDLVIKANSERGNGA